ncbi:MAG: glycosyltransferase family 4 protein [Nitrospiraceae bacterium]
MHAGEATNAYHLCKHLADRGLEVHVLTSRANRNHDDPRIHVHPIMNEWSWSEMFRMRSFFRRCAPDAVYLMYIGLMYKCHPMITFAPTMLKRLFPHVPFVTRYESAFVGADPSKTSPVARLFRRAMVQWAGGSDVAYGSGTLLRDSNHVIALCERHRAMLIEEWPPVNEKVLLIPPPPNLRIASNQDGMARSHGRAKLGFTGTDFVIVFFGYLYRTKGVEFLLRAFQVVQAERKGVKLVFVGGKVGLDVEESGDYFERMQSLARELQIEKDVTWTGAVNSDAEEGSLYLHAADVAVLPFLQGVQLNNSSLASIAAHSLPIIASRGPLLDTAFVDGSNVLLCEPKDHQAIARYIVQLIDDPRLLARMGKGAMKLAQEWFSWDTAIDRTLASFKA